MVDTAGGHAPAASKPKSDPSIQHLVLMTRVLTVLDLLAGGLACLLVSAELATAGELAATATGNIAQLISTPQILIRGLQSASTRKRGSWPSRCPACKPLQQPHIPP